MFFKKKLKNKDCKYGIYEMYIMNNEELTNEILKNIVLNTEDRKTIQLEVKNIPLLIRFQLEHYTNISEFYDLDIEFDKILNTKDRNLKKVLKVLKNNIIIISTETKNKLEQNFKNINTNMEQIVNILLN